MPKGQKKTKGIPELYNEVKKLVSLSLTPTAIMELDNLAKGSSLSRSEFVEQIARGLIPIVEEKSLLDGFIIYPSHVVSIEELDLLPGKMGAFIVTDFSSFAYVSHCLNLKKQFESKVFIDRLKQSVSDSWKFPQIKILWLECSNRETILRTEEELISQFRSSEIYRKKFAGEIDREFQRNSNYNQRSLGENGCRI